MFLSHGLLSSRNQFYVKFYAPEYTYILNIRYLCIYKIEYERYSYSKIYNLVNFSNDHKLIMLHTD